jgi:hypothetical protein
MPAAEVGAGPATLRLSAGPPRPVPDALPSGELLAAQDRDGGGPLYRLATTGARTVLRYPGVCEFTGDALLSDVVFHLDPAADPGLVPVLAAGALVAVHLRLCGALVLHASAVAVDDRGLAFVGSSGMGKSTVASALAAAGHPLVSDDVLRVTLTAPAGPLTHRGSTESRLRPSARVLADRADPAHVRLTADDRLALRLPAYREPDLPFAACVVPLPHRDGPELVLEQLAPTGALLWLLRFPRVVGWLDPAGSAREFQALGDLVERVPVYLARIPWGLPFAPGLLDELAGLAAAPSVQR